MGDTGAGDNFIISTGGVRCDVRRGLGCEDVRFYSFCLLMAGSYTDTDEVTFVEPATTAPATLTIDSQSMSVESCPVHILSRRRCEYRSSILASFFCFASPLRSFLSELTLSSRCAIF